MPPAFWISGLSVALSHVVFAGIIPDRVVHDAVEDRVGDGVAAEPVVSFLGHQLGGERGAGRVVAEFHELEQESFEWLVGFVDEPFVDGEQVVGGEHVRTSLGTPPDRPRPSRRRIALALIFPAMSAAPFATRASHGERSPATGGPERQ